MSSEYIKNFGIEVHLEIKTLYKGFSRTKTNFESKPNTNINEYDLGLPGSKPIVNKDFVLKAIRAAKILNMEISDELEFDRKHYFYSDLPKGFQITQYRKPLATNGFLEINSNNGKKRILIKRLHLEEDTAKQIHRKDKTLIDYNRAGNPLIEIVTDHKSFESENEVKLFLDLLRKEMIYSDISDGKLEEGSMRIDANVSVIKKNSSSSPVKVEIKNINSLNNLVSSLKIEIQDQIKSIENGKKIFQETKRFDFSKQKNISMRKKEDSIDYRYIPETNILPIPISDEFKNQLNRESSREYSILLEKYLKMGINKDSLYDLMSEIELFNIFEKLEKKVVDKNKLINYLNNDIKFLIENKSNIDKKFPQLLLELIELVEKNKITGKQFKEILPEVYKKLISPEKILKKKNIKILDEKSLVKFIEDIVNKNKDILDQYNSRPERVEKMLMGQLMKETKGQANPVKAIDLIKKTINKFLKT